MLIIKPDINIESEKIIDEKNIKNGCINRISEVEELRNYASFFVNLDEFENFDMLFDSLTKYYEDENYVMCIFEASKFKAELDIIISSAGISNSTVKEFTKNKLIAAKRSIKKQEEKNIFPIAGYSYYEYSEEFYEKEILPNSLLFSEYAIELSNLDIYLENGDTNQFSLFYQNNKIGIFAFLVGFIIGVIIHIFLKKRKQ